MSKLLTGLWMTFVLSGCVSPLVKKDVTIEVHFTYPDGWEILENMNSRVGNLLSIVKKEPGSSGLCNFIWTENDEINSNLDDLVDIYRDDLKARFLKRTDEVQFTDTYSGEFNGIKSRQTDYTLSVNNIPHRGKIIVFIFKDNAFMINQQGADKHLNENEEDFCIIENSFRVTKVN